MRVLYVVGACLSKNTSANMSHNGYVQGLLENGCQVDILMATDSWGQTDNFLPRWKDAKYYCYPAGTIHDMLRKYIGRNVLQPTTSTTTFQAQTQEPRKEVNLKVAFRGYLKKAYYFLFPIDPKYPLEKQWLKNASKFHADIEYDLVVSNSSPAASHKLVVILSRNGHLRYKRWIQIWEDPWYYDLYGGHREEIFDEENELLKAADEVFYVSPLTLVYQQRYFEESACKMKQIPLPYLAFTSESETVCDDVSFAYLGDYYSHVRNLEPFYQALCQTNSTGYIYGDSNIVFEKTSQIEISGRVTLDKLANVQKKATVLVHLCNLRGGQIPGKIYHYSATTKPILFILDGTPEEKKHIKEYFESFSRYYFCDNDMQSILSSMNQIKADIAFGKKWEPVTAFSPKAVVAQLLQT